MTAQLEQIQIIKIKNSPDIPGLSYRGFLGKQDYPHMADIINATTVVDQTENTTTVEDIERSYKRLQRSDTDKDMLFAEIFGEPVAYGRCMWSLVKENPEDYYQYFFFVHLKPEWRGVGLGKAMGAHLIDRIEEMAAEHSPEIKKKLETYASDTMPWHRQLAEYLGFEVVRYGITMNRPCSEPIKVLPLPDGIVVRPVSPENYRAVFDAGIEAFRDHWHFIEPTEEDYLDWLENPRFDPKLWKVAWEGDQIVGCVLNHIDEKENKENNRKRGYTENISTRRPWRRRGIARSLLTQSIRMFQEMGMEETALGVDTENLSGALNLYKDVGYKEIRRFITYQKPLG
jgi:ribosomal protein S18 acetylase RimI-like enzyme